MKILCAIIGLIFSVLALIVIISAFNDILTALSFFALLKGIVLLLVKLPIALVALYVAGSFFDLV